MLCKKCSMLMGWLLILAGILFLLRDLGVWGFWNIQWYTIAFVFIGFALTARFGCPMCQEECVTPPKATPKAEAPKVEIKPGVKAKRA